MNETLLSAGIDIGTSPQRSAGAARRGPHLRFPILGGSESRLRETGPEGRFHGLTPAPPCGAPVVEVPR